LLNGYFVPVIGKTGFTRAAGRCFAGAAALDDREVIVVVLGASDMWGDTRKLLEWALRGEGKDGWPNVQMARVPVPVSPASEKSAVAAETVRATEKTLPPAALARAVAASAPAMPVAASAPAMPVAASASAMPIAASGPARPALHSRPMVSREPRVVSTDPPRRSAVVAAQAWDAGGSIRRGCTGAGCGGSSSYAPSR
jgi:D-alanyl-D-alanine carboxypeptidase